MVSTKRNSIYNVLIIGQDRKQTELYAELIREVAPDCHLDVLSRVESSYEWVEQSNYQLIVVDARIDGLSLLEKIKRISPVTSVILISEEATVEHAVAAIRLGAEDYLKKPFNLETFQLAVKRGLDRKVVFGDDSGASNYLNLLNSCQMISASLEQSKIFGIVQGYFGRELRSDHTAIYALEESGPVHLEEIAGFGKRDRAMQEVLDIAVQASGAIQPMVESGELFRFVDRGQLTPALFIFRFRSAGTKDYFCICLSPERPASIENFEGRMKMLRAQLEVTGKNISQYMGVQTLAYVDDATGLYNTRYLNYVLDREITQYRASKKSFAVLFMDADHFKTANDTHGHLVGTRLLNELGAQLKSFVRDSDTVFRYGGDEFVAVLSPCDLETAKSVAERIRYSVENHTFMGREKADLRITVSIGVAIFPDHADSKKSIVDAADQAMYAAKKATRNSVFIANIKSIQKARIAKGKRHGG